MSKPVRMLALIVFPLWVVPVVLAANWMFNVQEEAKEEAVQASEAPVPTTEQIYIIYLGAQAQKRGVSRAGNPYDADTDTLRYRMWDAGWRHSAVAPVPREPKD